MDQPTIRNFIRAVCANWLALMSGAPSVPFALWALFAPEHQRLLFAILAFASLLIASYFIWKRERLAFLEYRKTREPKLRMALEQINSHQTPNDTASTSMLLVLSVRNTGAPSFLEDFQLNAIFSGGSTVAGKLRLIPDILQLDAHVFRGRDALYNRALTPIGTGALLRGILWFDLQNIKRESIVPGTEIEITFKDAYGEKHSEKVSVPAEEGKAEYFPGLSSPFL